MDLGLSGKVAVVTGASKGIGLATCQALASEGTRVVAGSRRGSPELDRLVDAGDVTSVLVDLADAAGPALLVDRAAASGGIDILVNNVGAATIRNEGFLALADEQWQQAMDINFFAALRAIRAAIPWMVERGSGHVVTICSVNAYLPDPGVIDYSAAKAAIWNLSKSLSKEFGARNLRFNTISPGPVETDLWMGRHGVAQTFAAAHGVDFETAKAEAVESQGGFTTGRFTQPSEVADLVLLLASDRAGNVNGSDFMIDGGLVKTL